MGNGSQVGQGAIGGAELGAGIGAMGGPLGMGAGALIGGAGGALMGWLGGNGAQDYQSQLQALADQYGRAGSRGPQAGPASQANYSQFRQNQAGLIAQLEAMARGQGPSASAIQMREAMDRAAGAQASAAAGAGGRGVNAGAALRNAQNNTAAVQAQGARDTGMMRTQEQLGAIGQLGGAISQGRAADEGVNTFNANANNQMAQANLEAKLRSMGINTQAQFQALQMAMGAAGPGLGTQILAGGASAMPGLMQMGNAYANKSGPMGTSAPMANGGFNYGNPGSVSDFVSVHDDPSGGGYNPQAQQQNAYMQWLNSQGGQGQGQGY